MEVRGQLVLFGGFQSDGQPRADTWTWDGEEWRELRVSGPAPRRWPAMAYDPHRERLILHGGRDGVGAAGRPLDDTWEWDGDRWRRISTSGPGGRDHHRLAYDARRDRMVLFGGWDGRTTRSDTWELDGDAWVPVAATGPAARAAHGLSYDPERETVVLFGGSSDTLFYDDTWLWDGLEWSRVDVPGPSARSFHGMTFDRARGTMVLAGGRRGSELFGDTWTFDGSHWTRTADLPAPARYIYDLAWDTVRGQIVFHGGGFMRDGRWALFDETWIWDGSGWSRG
jgi:hypothetical protein